MQKCNPFYRLKKKLNDESGITLVELIAAISILSIIILLAGSIHLFGQRQFKSQTESASQSNDFSYALTDMTTELRKYAPSEVTVEGKVVKVKGVIMYEQSGSNLLKNKTSIASSVDNFKPIKSEDGNFITIEITKINPTAANKNYHTTIYFRGE